MELQRPNPFLLPSLCLGGQDALVVISRNGLRRTCVVGNHPNAVHLFKHAAKAPGIQLQMNNQLKYFEILFRFEAVSRHQSETESQIARGVCDT